MFILSPRKTKASRTRSKYLANRLCGFKVTKRTWVANFTDDVPLTAVTTAANLRRVDCAPNDDRTRTTTHSLYSTTYYCGRFYYILKYIYVYNTIVEFESFDCRAAISHFVKTQTPMVSF